MKKTILLLLLLVLSLGVLCACNKDDTLDMLDFELTADGEGYEITGVNFEGMTSLVSLEIPETYKGKPIVAIGPAAFQGCRKLEAIHIPSTVTYIGSSAFIKTAYYENPENWENGLLYIGEFLIDTAENLYGTCVIKEGTACIADYAFFEINLVSVELPTSLKIIADDAFYGNTNLVEIYNKSSLSLQAGSRSHGEVAYYAKNIYTPSSGASKLLNQDDFLFYEENGEYTLLTYVGKETELRFPTSVNGNNFYVISWNAFKNRADLTAVTLTSGVKDIREGAFDGCVGLTSFKLPASMTIFRRFLNGCTGIETVVIPTSIKEINDNNVFYHCTSLATVEYEGTKEQWRKIEKPLSWHDENSHAIICSDGVIEP